MKKKSADKLGIALVVLGALLILAAGAMVLYNRHDDTRAGQTATEALELLVIDTPMTTEALGELVIPDYVLNEDMDMPAEPIRGYPYIGRLDMPSIGMALPIIETWSYDALRVSPCCYHGSVYKDNMVIAGHNYTAHFGKIGRLKEGDQITFTDIDGNVFHYRVWGKEELPAEAVSEMLDPGWDLTLFTCTLSRTSRITVRCLRDEEES